MVGRGFVDTCRMRVVTPGRGFEMKGRDSRHRAD